MTPEMTGAGDLHDRRGVLRGLLARRDATLLPGVANALAARIVQDLGYEAAYLSGAGLTNTYFGLPDLGLINATDVVEATARISDVCSLPLIVDMDTGFGNALNAYHTVQRLERAGAAAIQIEDQTFPKKCGHFAGKGVIPLDEMLGKIRACADARRDDGTVIIARTDARAALGLEAALDRAHRMAEAGADLLFVEAPESEAEVRAIGALPVPQLINLVVGGKTPMMPVDALREAGFSLVLYANATLQAAMKAMQEVMGALLRDGSLDAVQDRLATFTERQRLVGKPGIDRLAARYEGA